MITSEVKAVQSGGLQVIGFCLVVELALGGPATNAGLPCIVNRPDVAGAVLQTPLSFID